MCSVVHIITGLRQGGAEGALYRLLSGSQSKERFVVISLLDDGVYARRIRALNVPVYSLGMHYGPSFLFKFISLIFLLRSLRPDVVQTWMYHADLVGGLAARMGRVRRVFWGIRNSDLETMQIKWSSRLTLCLCARLSRLIPSKAVSCSQRAIQLHQEAGYKSPFVAIPNGFDLNALFPAPDAGDRLRESWGLDPEAPIFGCIGRFEPKKDHTNFLRAAGLVAKDFPAARFVMCGAGITDGNAELMRVAEEAGIGGRLLLLGPRDDIPDIMNALDFLVLSSAYGEAFPNVVAEAMACGTPCVVTDVGDAAEIVGNTGWVVPPRDAQSLAQAMLAALGEGMEPRKLRQKLARQRIMENYAIETMVARYEQLWGSGA